MKNLAVLLISALAFLSLGAWFSLSWNTEADFNTALAAGWLSGDWPTSGTVNKFGANMDVDTAEESVWDVDDLPTSGDGPIRCFANMGTTAAALYVSSDDATDAGLGIAIEVLDSTWTKSVVEMNLGVANAGTGTNLDEQIGTADLLRVNRAYATGDSFTGNIYIHKDGTGDTLDDGIPDTVATDMVAGITAGENQTLQACYTVPLGFDALLTQYCVGNVTNTSAVTFRLRRSVAGAASRTTELNIKDNNTSECVIHDPPIVFAEKTDIELTADGALANNEAYGIFDLLVVPNDL